MEKKNIVHSIVSASRIDEPILPLDILLIEGKSIPAPSEYEATEVARIKIKVLSYDGPIRKSPYGPISNIYKLM